MNRHRRLWQTGFTLIELVVAMAIFALLALAGWKVFDGLMRTRERATAHADQLSAWQIAYAQLLRDCQQAIARPVVTSTGPEAALVTDGQTLTLTRTGVIDPRINQSDGIARVRYEVQNQQLVRLSLDQPDQWGMTAPLKQVLLNDVSDWQVQALDQGASAIWPPLDSSASAANPPVPNKQLPRGIIVNFKQGTQALTWQFALTPNAPVLTSNTSNNNSNANNNTTDNATPSNNNSRAINDDNPE